MTGLLTAAELASIREGLGLSLPHTYSRVTRSLGAEDAHGNKNWEAAAAATAQPCRYVPAGRGFIDQNGQFVQAAPSLLVPHDDPLEAGDLVEDVADDDGVLVAGPLAVLAVDALGEGVLLLKRASLEQRRVAS